MPSPATQHPDDFDLLAYAGGKLRARDRDPIEFHLAACGRCVARLDALMMYATPDPLLRRLRSFGDSKAEAEADPTPVPGSVAAESWPALVRQLAAVGHPNLLMPRPADRTGTGTGQEPPPADGIDFHALACAQNRPEVALVCDYFRQAAVGLAAAHAEGVVHGDLKLADLRLFGRATVRVTGFLDARVRAGPPPDPAGDIVALGRCFAALLSGRAYGTGHAESPSSGLDRTLPPEVFRVLSRLTAADPAKRYATMAEAAADLASLVAPAGERRPWWRRTFGSNG